MSAGDCLNCGGDGYLPGSLGATKCPVCKGTANMPTKFPADVLHAFIAGIGVGALAMLAVCLITAVCQ